MFIFDFRYDRKLGGRQEVGSPNLHGRLMSRNNRLLSVKIALNETLCTGTGQVLILNCKLQM